MDPNQLLATLAPQIKAMAAAEGERAALAALKKAQTQMVIGFVLAALAGGFLGAKVFR